MVTQYAFFVNSDACSGCKTCQVACKDRHDVRGGGHWRRVIEVMAGGWQQKGGLWTSTVAAYHLSVACHHCADPVCAERMPGRRHLEAARRHRAHRRQPLHAMPQVRGRLPVRRDPLGRSMPTPSRKCDFCVDDIDSGVPPACVVACPNRALDFGELSELRARYGKTQQVYPLPDPVHLGSVAGNQAPSPRRGARGIPQLTRCFTAGHRLLTTRSLGSPYTPGHDRATFEEDGRSCGHFVALVRNRGSENRMPNSPRLTISAAIEPRPNVAMRKRVKSIRADFPARVRRVSST